MNTISFSLSKFRTYQLSLEFHHLCRQYRIPGYLKSQLLRAAASVSLNLAEGCARAGEKDRLRFYGIAFASLREAQAALDLAELPNPSQIRQLADQLGGSLYRLCNPERGA